MGTSKQITPMAGLQNEEYNPTMAEVAARAACETQEVKITAAATSGATQPTKTQHPPRLSSKLPAATSSAKGSLEALLEKRNLELEKQQGKYAKLVRSYNDLVKEFNEQMDFAKKLQAQSDFYERLASIMLHDCVMPYATQQGPLPKQWDEATVSSVVTPLCRDAKETESLRIQLKAMQEDLQIAKNEVQILQKDMLAKVEKVNATTDEEFAQEFRNLVSLVRTLSREIRITGFDMSTEAFASGVMVAGIPPHLWGTRVLKKYLLEAWFWSVLIDNVFRSPFVVFGKRCDALSATWQELNGSARGIEWPSPTALSEAWRCTTVEQILGIVEQSTCPQGRLGDQYQRIHEDIFELRDGIINALLTGLKPETSATHLPKMYQIMEKAIALSAQMAVQRARLQVMFPRIGAAFDTSAMSAVPGVDGEDIETGRVAFIIHPGLTKWGDAHGRNLDQRYDIVPSMVNVEPAGPVQETFSR